MAAIEQSYYRVAKKDKTEALCRLMDYEQPARSLIFCNTKRMVDEMTQELKKRGYEAEGLHGDLSQNQRDTVMNLFRSGRVAILLATDVAARGIDVSGVDAVFNYDVPEDIEYYVHRIGRTGRAGREGSSFTLVSGREVLKIHDIERICHTKIKEKRLPGVREIMQVKYNRSIADALENTEGKDLQALMDRLEQTCDELGKSELEIAAAFLYQSIGEEPEELQEERYYFDRNRRQDNRRTEGRDGRRSNSNYRGRESRYRDEKGRDRYREGNMRRNYREDKGRGTRSADKARQKGQKLYKRGTQEK